MGASDDIARGSSTFMTEMQEAADILRRATRRSLVILDELGRGTSTHDGVAIAHATLQHMVDHVKSLTLFVTHYPSIGDVQKMHPKSVANYHMSYMLQPRDGDELEHVTFLYRLADGVADKSYGLNVARLADLPQDLVMRAKERAAMFEDGLKEREKRSELARKVQSVFKQFA